mgnify:CR=1 FL=1
MSNRHGEKDVGLQVHRVRMCQSDVLFGRVAHCLRRVLDHEDAQGADPHHGLIGLAVEIRTTP